MCWIRLGCCTSGQVVEVFHEGDMIWVHGFHLAVLPAFLERIFKVRRIHWTVVETSWRVSR